MEERHVLHTFLIQPEAIEDPNVPVPPHKYEHLKGSTDVFMRAAYWCFVAAHNNEIEAGRAASMLGYEQAKQNARQARLDGHRLHAFVKDAFTKDFALTSASHLEHLQSRALLANRRLIMVAVVALAVGFAIGIIGGVGLGSDLGLELSSVHNVRTT